MPLSLRRDATGALLVPALLTIALAARFINPPSWAAVAAVGAAPVVSNWEPEIQTHLILYSFSYVSISGFQFDTDWRSTDRSDSSRTRQVNEYRRRCNCQERGHQQCAGCISSFSDNGTTANYTGNGRSFQRLRCSRPPAPALAMFN